MKAASVRRLRGFQPLHSVYAGGIQATAVEGEDHIKEAGRDLQDDRRRCFGDTTSGGLDMLLE